MGLCLSILIKPAARTVSSLATSALTQLKAAAVGSIPVEIYGMILRHLVRITAADYDKPQKRPKGRSTSCYEEEEEEFDEYGRPGGDQDVVGAVFLLWKGLKIRSPGESESNLEALGRFQLGQSFDPSHGLRWLRVLRVRPRGASR
jgi:hypothetical protein